MYPGKKLTVNGKGLHEYDYLNVSERGVAKSFDFKEVIVKYYLRWVHFPKLESQCELYSKKTNALLIITVADYTEKWEKFWTKKDPKTFKCATDYCYIVDFQVDPQRLETLKSSLPEMRGKKLPEEINGRIVLYARSNVQPREDKFKSPINMYESFMRKEGPPAPGSSPGGAMDGGFDLVFSPRHVAQPQPSGQDAASRQPIQAVAEIPAQSISQSDLTPLAGQPSTNDSKNSGQTDQPSQSSGQVNQTQNDVNSSGQTNQTNPATPKIPPITITNVLSPRTIGQIVNKTTSQPQLNPQITATNAANKTVSQPQLNITQATYSQTTSPPISTPTKSANATTTSAPSTPIAIVTDGQTPSTPSDTTANIAVSTGSPSTPDSVLKKDSLHQMRTTRNWSASRPNKSRSNSGAGLLSNETRRNSGGLEYKSAQVKVETTTEMSQNQVAAPQEPQTLQSSQTIEKQVEVPQVQTTVQETKFVEPVVIAPQITAQEPMKQSLIESNGSGVQQVNTENALNVQPKNVYETSQRNPFEKSPRPISQHVDFDMDSAIAPSSSISQTPNPTLSNSRPSVFQRPTQDPDPNTGVNVPVMRRTSSKSVSDMPLFKRYSQSVSKFAARSQDSGNSSPTMQRNQPPVVESIANQSNTDFLYREKPSFEITMSDDPIESLIEPMIIQPIMTEQPTIQQPVIEHPIVEQPVIEQPIIEEPIIEQPVVEQPSVEQPIVEQPSAHITTTTELVTIPEKPTVPSTGLTVPQKVPLARPSGGAATLDEPLQNIIAPRAQLFSGTDYQDQTSQTPTQEPSIATVHDAQVPEPQLPVRESIDRQLPPRVGSVELQPPRRESVERQLPQPPKTALKQPLTMPKHPPPGPRHSLSLSRPLTQPPQPKTSVQTRPLTQPPQPKTNVQTTPQHLPPQPQGTVTARPPKAAPPQPKQTTQPRLSVETRPQTLPPQPNQSPQAMRRPVTQPPRPAQQIPRPAVEPPQIQQVPQQQPAEDDPFAEPLMETYRPVPPKPWKAIGKPGSNGNNM